METLLPTKLIAKLQLGFLFWFSNILTPMNSKQTISNIKFKWTIFSHILSIDQNYAVCFSLINIGQS